ncbi:MAG: DUF418 domain-containing protein [Bryobacterales bacterium]|nr:DUF418 domain-containing protein [Bryobacterales bacterium]
MQPLSTPERYAPLDVLRGAALFGVLIVNLLTLFRVSLLAHITHPDTDVVSTLVAVLIEFKAFTLFTLLFGLGVGVQAERASARGGAALLLTRRFLVLLVIGLAHLVLIWNGDILTLYAVCGLLLIPMLRLPAMALAVGGAALAIGSYFGALPVHLPGVDAMRAQAAAAVRVYGGGGWGDILLFRWEETLRYILPLLILTLPKTLGVMMLGVAAWRWEIFTRRRLFVWMILFAGGVIGSAGTVVHSDLASQIPLAFAYAAVVLLWAPSAPLLAAGGRMALTNYLTQSVVFSFVFYGYGLGLFGRLDVWPTALGGVIFYVAQLVLSRAWLRRFPFGPVEWLWRRLTYGAINRSGSGA